MQYNGAQAHDLVLRLSEMLPSDAIHHVAEILYHYANYEVILVDNWSISAEAWRSPLRQPNFSGCGY